MMKFKLFAFVVFGGFLIQGCSENSVGSDKAQSQTTINSIKGKYIRVGDNKRAGIEGILDLVSDIEFRNEHCHFTYVTTKMSGKYSIDEGFIYIYTGGELGTLSMEIINKDHLEGEGYIHGTFKREGTFKPIEKAKRISESNKNSKSSSSTNSQANNPFATGGNSEEPESNENEIQVENKSAKSPFGSGGSNFGNASGNDGSGPGSGSGSARVRLNDPEVGHIIPNEDCTIYLKVTINELGEIVSVANMTSKTTTTDQRLINQVSAAVKKDVRYTKSPGAPLVNQFITIKLYAQ
jgi:hypothetical protein